MKYRYTAVLICPAPTPANPRAMRHYSYVYVIATSKDHATALVQKHLDERKPLGFTEREIRKMNPKRTPWKEGVRIESIWDGSPANDSDEIGVVCD